jgi:hypothetical protein
MMFRSLFVVSAGIVPADRKRPSSSNKSAASFGSGKRASFKETRDPGFTGARFKSQKAGGDVRRKGDKFEPFAYVPLDPRALSSKYVPRWPFPVLFAVFIIASVVSGSQRRQEISEPLQGCGEQQAYVRWCEDKTLTCVVLSSLMSHSPNNVNGTSLTRFKRAR